MRSTSHTASWPLRAFPDCGVGRLPDDSQVPSIVFYYLKVSLTHLESLLYGSQSEIISFPLTHKNFSFHGFFDTLPVTGDYVTFFLEKCEQTSIYHR